MLLINALLPGTAKKEMFANGYIMQITYLTNHKDRGTIWPNPLIVNLRQPKMNITYYASLS